MLVFLGVQVFWKLRRNRLHVHDHAHDGDRHVHIHGSHDSSRNIEKGHGFFHFGKPVFRFKSFTIGVIHGLAGSAAVTLVLLPAMPSFWIGFGYFFLFGIGTILAMAIITIILGVPFALTTASSKWSWAVSGAAGTASVVLGFALASDVALNTTFVPF
jgi:ABC-type nickel/cobalt efflux system permease component RcnA